MISKLVSFEVRSTFRLLMIVWAALLATAILISIIVLATGNNFYQSLMQSSNAVHIVDKIINTLTMILYVALFVAQIVLTVAIIVMRFYRGMFGEEGYLMHTLPVDVSRLIISKGIVASAAVLGSMIIGTVSIMMIVFAFGPALFHEQIKAFFSLLGKEPVIVLYIFEGLIILLVSIIASVYQVYAALSLGQMANRHRIIISLAAYIGMGMVLSTVGVVLGVLAASTGLGEWIEELATGKYLGPQLLILGSFLASAIPVVLFHILTEKILTYRLNLL